MPNNIRIEILDPVPTVLPDDDGGTGSDDYVRCFNEQEAGYDDGGETVTLDKTLIVGYPRPDLFTPVFFPVPGSPGFGGCSSINNKFRGLWFSQGSWQLNSGGQGNIGGVTSEIVMYTQDDPAGGSMQEWEIQMSVFADTISVSLQMNPSPSMNIESTTPYGLTRLTNRSFTEPLDGTLYRHWTETVLNEPDPLPSPFPEEYLITAEWTVDCDTHEMTPTGPQLISGGTGSLGVTLS